MDKDKDLPLVSIVINNYNYESFVSQSIQSALSQTYSKVEIVIVDDGSTDNSRTVINEFSKEIIPVFKRNGGQASAINVGVSVAKGDIIMLLDSDDVLLPDLVARVVAAFSSMNNVAKVQYRMRVTDSDLHPTGEVVPPAHQAMPNGDLRSQISTGINYVWPPTSGNAFSSEALRKIMPIPEDTYRLSADVYLNTVAIALGAIISLEEVGVMYRVHGNNSTVNTSRSIDLPDLRNHLLGVSELHNVIEEQLQQNLELKNKDFGFLVGRVISCKLDASGHPFEENLLRLCLTGIADATRSSMSFYQKILFVLWFICMPILPKPIARYVSSKLVFPWARSPQMKKTINLIKRVLGSPTMAS